MSLEQTLRPYSSASDGKILLNRINVEGKIPSSLIKIYTNELQGAHTVEEASVKLAKLQQNLLGLGVFKDVQMFILPENELKIKLVSSNKYAAKVGTSVGSEGSGYIRGSVNNFLGLCETFSLDSSAGTQTKSSNIATLVAPLPFERLGMTKMEALGYNSSKQLDHNQCLANIYGGTLRLVNKGVSLGFDSVLRELKNRGVRPVDGMLSNYGFSYKFSGFANFIMDRMSRGFTEYENRGYTLKLENEYAFRGSKFPFAKSLFTLRSWFPVNNKYGISGSLNTQLGIISPLNDSRELHILDKFYLGGPLSVRGFKDQRMGRHDNGVSLGGHLMASLGLSIYTPFTKYPSLRNHSFLNVGYLGTEPAIPSVSFGSGIVYSSDQARIEFNWCLPLIARSHEPAKGLSFGVGLEYL